MYQVMVMLQTAVATAAKDSNISLYGLDRAKELEQKESRGTFLPLLASNPHLYRRFFWYFSSPYIKAYI